MKKILLFIFSSVCLNLIAQQRPNVEGWRVHLPYQKATTLAEVADKIYVGSPSGIFTVDISDFSIERLSKITGLSDVEVKLVRHNPLLNLTIIVYQNANIDIIDHKANNIINLPDLLQLNIIGSKAINNICFYNNNLYLATDFGIVLVDLENKRVIDSYQNLGNNGSNLSFNDVAIFNNIIYGATNLGIYTATLDANNLSDFNFWKKTSTFSYANHLEVFNSKLYANVDSNLKVFDGLNAWTAYATSLDGKVRSLQVNNNKLSITTSDEVIIQDANGLADKKSNIKNRNEAIVCKNDKLFLVDNSFGAQMYPGLTGEFEYIIPNGPTSISASAINYGNGATWVAAGAVDDSWQKQFFINRFYKFQNNTWENYIDKNIPELNGITDILEVKVNPRSGKVYAASFGNGIFEMDENASRVINKYDSSNSSLRPNYNPSFPQLYASSIDFDGIGNMWVANHSAPEPISVMNTDGTWKSFSIGGLLGGANEITKIKCDQDSNKWVILKRELGVLVFNSVSNQVKILTKDVNNGALPSNQVYCAVPDKNGSVWIGTSQGLTILSNPGLIFATPKVNFDAQQIVIKTGLVYSNFLGTEAINCIKVDGGNRKWIGTRNGVWYVSPDGYTVIHNFTTANSPLLSNNVLEIGIDEKTGEVFFATDKGIISYMGTSTEPDSRLSNIFIYPNPVRPEYNGLISIKGLIKNTIVKITDISGNLVYETTSNGGTATWDGTTFRGNRAATGVYLIFAAERIKGEESQVGKILFIN